MSYKSVSYLLNSVPRLCVCVCVVSVYIFDDLTDHAHDINMQTCVASDADVLQICVLFVEFCSLCVLCRYIYIYI